MRITKNLAKEIATKLMEPKCEALTGKIKILEEKSEIAVRSTIPAIVLEAYKVKPKYINTRSSWYCQNTGFNNSYIRSANALPSVSQYINLDSNHAAEILTLTDEVDSLRKNYNESLTKLESVIFAIRTTDKLKVTIPESEPFIPADGTVSTGLMLNPEEIKSLFK